MHAAIDAVAHSLARVAMTPPMSGSIAALARWNSRMQHAKMMSGRVVRRRGQGAADDGADRSNISARSRYGATSLIRMRASASTVGTTNAAVTRNPAWFDRKWPDAP